MRRVVFAVVAVLFLGGLSFVGQGCSSNPRCQPPGLCCPWEYSAHNLLHSASASCEDVATRSYVHKALTSSCHNNHYGCNCQHRDGVDGIDCTCKRVDKFDGRCRCDWKAPYCLCGYYE